MNSEKKLEARERGTGRVRRRNDRGQRSRERRGGEGAGGGVGDDRGTKVPWAREKVRGILRKEGLTT